jgi:hypothetical protein
MIVLGLLTAAINRFRSKETETSRPVVIPPACCGQHEVCERDSLRASLSERISYYDDEELDRFRGTEAGAYTEEAANEFREVLYTLRTGEIAAWLRSLQLRGLNLPDSLKDEAFLLLGEQQKHA